MTNASSSAPVVRAVAGTDRGPGADTAGPAVLERLEGRMMLSAGAGDGDAVLRAWWARSGSSQLTVMLAHDSAREPRAASRPSGVRGAYGGGGAATGDASAAAAPVTATSAAPALVAATSVAPASAAAVVLPVMPNSDAWYSAVVNANQYIVNYQQNVPADLKLITDLVAPTQQEWAPAVATTQAQHPGTLIGTYHSFRDAEYAGTVGESPRRAVPREGLTSSQILMATPGSTDTWVVNYSQAAARKHLVKHVVQDVVNTGRPVAFLDNVSHHETGFPINWTTTTGVLKEMATNLRNAGKRVLVNAAWVPGITATTSVDQFIATGVDGVSLEMAFHQNVRNSVARINTAMQQYRKMLDAGMTVVFIPIGNATGDPATIENTEIEQRVQAAFGMMFRKPGDKLFVNQFFWRPVQEWTDWTKRFGPALGAATVTTNAAGQIVMTRRFANCTLTLNTATKEVSYV